MRITSVLKLVLIAIFTAFLFLGVISVFAIVGDSCPEPPCEEPPPPCVPGPEVCSSSPPYRCNDFAVYKCANNFCGKAGGAMEQGLKWYDCVDWECSDGCNSTNGTDIVGGPHGPDQIGPYGMVPDYRICPAAYNDWGTSPPTPECSGSCYPAPELKPLNDALLLPKNVFDGLKLKLPINFSWEDNVAKEVAKAPNFCTVGSYEFNIVDPPLSKIATDTQIQRTKDPVYNLECLLKSDTDYQWRVRACLDAGGTDCGDWPDSQDFSTSLAPELISPYDPDWEGTTSTKNVALPITLDWCDVEEAQTYRLNLYVVSGGEKICHPWLLKTKGGETICEPWLLEKTTRERYQEDEILYSDFSDQKMDFFTRSTEYQWQLKTCKDKYGLSCADYGQLWSFTTASTTLPFTSQLYPADDPTGKNPVGLPLVLQWSDKPGINSYYYEVTPVKGGATITGKNTASQSLPLDYPQLALNAAYKWKVNSCWDYEAKKCETAFSQEWQFTTTGRPPQLLYPASEADKIPIPLTLNWEDVPGASSYVFKIQGDDLILEKVLNESEFPMAFPEFNIRQEKNYSWQVKTCAWQGARGACGSYSGLQSFKTFRMSPPIEPNPTDKGKLSTDDKTIAWKAVTGAKAYQYQIKYLSLSGKETDPACLALVDKFETPDTVNINSAFIELKCLGDYQWQARGCLDENCEEVGVWSSWSFSLMEPGDIIKGAGLIPCGQPYNNLKTPWNEREPCQFKHLFLLFKVIIDFLLLRAIPIILVLLTIITGLIFYTSLGQMMTMAKVISLWRAALIGLAIIFFAWTIVNLFLKLVGYNIGIFGNWYQLPM